MNRVKISDFAEVITGGTPSTSVSEYWENGDIPWLQSGACQNCIITTCDTFITKAGLDNSAAKMMKPNSVLIALTGATTGKVGFLTFPACANQSVTGIQPNDHFIPKYLYYYLKGIRQKIIDDSYGGAQKHISQGYVKNIEIPLVSIENQAKIADAFEMVDRIILDRQRQLHAFDDLIKARFVEMFGNPVDTHITRMPLEEYVDSIRYGTSQPPEFSADGEYMFIRATNIKNGRIIDKDMLYISAEEAKKIEKCKLSGGELIIVRSGANTGDTCIITEKYKGQYAGYDIIISLKTDSINPIYLNELINIPEYMRTIVKPLTARSAQPHLSTQQVQSLPVIVSEIERQNEFAEFCKQIDKSKFVVQKALDEAQLLFDSLMQQYFG